MLEIIQYATSGFWVFCGVFLMLCVVCSTIAAIFVAIFSRGKK